MKTTNFYFQQFQNRVESEPQKYYQDYLKVKERVNNSSAIYKGKPVDFLYQPFYLTEKDLQKLEYLTGTLSTILNKVIKEFYNNPDFRRNFLFSPLMEELILQNPGYQQNFPMARFDIFYRFNGDSKFCELNADGSSGMNEVTVLQNIIKKSRALKERETKEFELFDSWLKALLLNYKEYNRGIVDKPNIAIVDFEGEGVIYEFKEFKKRFNEKGYKTIICDPRQLKYRKGNLYYKNIRIDLIYRRATTIRLIEEADSIKDFINAYKDGAVCVVGGLVSQLIHNKIIFAILHDKNKVSFLNKEEHDFIEKHIPETFVFNYYDCELMERIKEEKDNYVLKPFDGAASYGVFAGKDYSEDEWEKIMKDIKDKKYLVQEFVEIPRQNMVTVDTDKGKIYFEKYGYLIGVFLYNQRLSGLYVRAGRKNIIGSIVECFTVPSYIV